MIVQMRDKLIQVRVNKEEQDRIKKLASSENFVSVSDYLRKMALDRCDEKGL